MWYHTDLSNTKTHKNMKTPSSIPFDIIATEKPHRTMTRRERERRRKLRIYNHGSECPRHDFLTVQNQYRVVSFLHIDDLDTNTGLVPLMEPALAEIEVCTQVIP